MLCHPWILPPLGWPVGTKILTWLKTLRPWPKQGSSHHAPRGLLSGRGEVKPLPFLNQSKAGVWILYTGLPPSVKTGLHCFKQTKQTIRPKKKKKQQTSNHTHHSLLKNGVKGPKHHYNMVPGCIFALFSISTSLPSANIIDLDDPGQCFSIFLVSGSLYSFLKYWASVLLFLLLLKQITTNSVP